MAKASIKNLKSRVKKIQHNSVNIVNLYISVHSIFHLLMPFYDFLFLLFVFFPTASVVSDRVLACHVRFPADADICERGCWRESHVDNFTASFPPPPLPGLNGTDGQG